MAEAGLSMNELLSGLFGFYSMGAAVCLFAPEFVDVWRHPMAEMDVARFAFFASWLVGDAAMLAGLLIVGEYIITQMVLYTVILTLEVALLLLMMWTVGDLCCGARVKRHSDEPLSHLMPAVHGQLNMPPGDDTLEKRREARAKERGEPTLKERARRRATVQLIGTVVILVIFSLVWLVVDFLPREHKEPPPVSKMPDPSSSTYTAEQVAYILAWVGFPCWTVPRLYCMFDSYRKRAKEGITVATIFLGVLAHGTNMASVMLINYEGEALQAQLSYILTSAVCILFDGMRLGLKYMLRNAKQLPPEYDYSNMWPYERTLPDYDPSQYANVHREHRSQPILRRRRKGAQNLSEEDDKDEKARLQPAERVDRKYRRADDHHANALKSNLLGGFGVGMYPDMHTEVARPDHTREERRDLEDRNEERRIRAGANRDWAQFRKKQVRLRQLQMELDDVKWRSIQLEGKHAKARKGRRSPDETLQLEKELHALQERQNSLEMAIRDLLAEAAPHDDTLSSPLGSSGTLLPNPDGLTPARFQQLENEHNKYGEYARKRDQQLDTLRSRRELKQQQHHLSSDSEQSASSSVPPEDSERDSSGADDRLLSGSSSSEDEKKRDKFSNRISRISKRRSV
ncbi:hypothetical protein JCM10908_002664 [Rhodotorula pacifica]|uniref:uncharacterized protein n=1 Tax=Rhodotorula pacifica TaxID=1495444 RepID=UPI00316FA797